MNERDLSKLQKYVSNKALIQMEQNPEWEVHDIDMSGIDFQMPLGQDKMELRFQKLRGYAVIHLEDPALQTVSCEFRPYVTDTGNLEPWDILPVHRVHYDRRKNNDI